MKINTKTLKPIQGSTLSAFEILNPITDEHELFHIAYNKQHIAVVSICNTGFIPEFYIDYDHETFSISDHLQALYDLIYEAMLNDTLDELSGHIQL